MNGVATTAALILDAVGKVADAIRRKDEILALNELARATRLAQAWKAVVDHYKGIADTALRNETERLVEVNELRRRVAELERLVEILQGGPQS